MRDITVLLLSSDDVVALSLGPSEVVAVVKQALREHAEGTYEMHPKIGVHPTKPILRIFSTQCRRTCTSWELAA